MGCNPNENSSADSVNLVRRKIYSIAASTSSRESVEKVAA